MMTQLSHPSIPNYPALSDPPTATSALALRRKSLKQLRLYPRTIDKIFSPSPSHSTTKRQKLSSATETYQKTPHQHPSYKKGPIAILPHLYIGNETNAHTWDQLIGIDCILNVAAEVGQPKYQSIVPWLDKMKKPATDSSKGYYKLATLQHGEELQIDDAIHLIDQAKKNKKSTLVHCQCGVARSASVVIAYIMRYLDLPLHEAYAFVQKRAPAISPNLTLLYQLQSLEKNHHHLPLVSNQSPGVDNNNVSNTPSKNNNKKRKLDLLC
ncbi:protein-tyrosine phosphatase-like protein [Absidia repens]|uniref:protein-tyrosine-phosphatase n=1 Tax=Absidia repens TaxID=90262 RepID=A0A1X2IBU7_9FUNG|nr:protein-tyrosine phosphatase-like protein [Absidia repens]